MSYRIEVCGDIQSSFSLQPDTMTAIHRDTNIAITWINYTIAYNLAWKHNQSESSTDTEKNQAKIISVYFSLGLTVFTCKIKLSTRVLKSCQNGALNEWKMICCIFRVSLKVPYNVCLVGCLVRVRVIFSMVIFTITSLLQDYWTTAPTEPPTHHTHQTGL